MTRRSTATITPISLYFSLRGQNQVAEIAFNTIERQTRQSISASGVAYPTGTTKNPLTMINTGEMILRNRDKSSTFSQNGQNPIGKIELEFKTSYASAVNARYNWAGISNRFIARFEADIQPVLETEITGR